MSENRHPVKMWLKEHFFEILNFILGIIGTITGILALYFNK